MVAGVRAVVFDAYGTLLDVARGTEGACERLVPGRGAALAGLWRAKQLEYAWLRALMGDYRDFWTVTRDALEHAARALGLELDGQDRERLAAAYLELPAFPDAAPALHALRGRVRAVLSNGTPAMLAAALSAAGLADRLDAVLGADEVRTYKPDPAVYALAPRRLGVDPGAVLFVSGNYWDCAGAARCGLRAVWVDRAGAAPDLLGAGPAHRVRGLTDVVALAGGAP